MCRRGWDAGASVADKLYQGVHMRGALKGSRAVHADAAACARLRDELLDTRRALLSCFGRVKVREEGRAGREESASLPRARPQAGSPMPLVPAARASSPWPAGPEG